MRFSSQRGSKWKGVFSLLLLAVFALTISSDSACGQNDAKEAKKKPPAAAKAKPAKKKRKVRPEFAQIEDVAGLPRVLLLGDSISIGYTLMVRKGLDGIANVHRPPINCGPTTKGLQGIDNWLGEKKWDVIHFNFGLHDLKYMGPNNENLADPNDPKNHQQVPPEEYEKNLRTLVEKLKATGAKLIWRNTTPVPDGAAGRVVGDSVKYNEIAAKVMKENDIPTHDLYDLVKPKMKELMLPKGNVHFTKAGSQALADDVVAVVSEALQTESE